MTKQKKLTSCICEMIKVRSGMNTSVIFAYIVLRPLNGLNAMMRHCIPFLKHSLTLHESEMEVVTERSMSLPVQIQTVFICSAVIMLTNMARSSAEI